MFESLDDWNNGDEGLDFYEPYFQRPLDQWMEKKFSVKLTIPEDSLTKELFYFCHIHKGMSGLIAVSDPAPDANELAIPFDPETYYVPKDAFDEACGTSGLHQFGTEYSEFCPDMEFVCVGDASSQYTECLEAVNCQMNYEMRVPVVSDSGEGVLVNFMHEMIPHHVNAVNMARFASGRTAGCAAAKRRSCSSSCSFLVSPPPFLLARRPHVLTFSVAENLGQSVLHVTSLKRLHSLWRRSFEALGHCRQRPFTWLILRFFIFMRSYHSQAPQVWAPGGRGAAVVSSASSFRTAIETLFAMCRCPKQLYEPVASAHVTIV